MRTAASSHGHYVHQLAAETAELEAQNGAWEAHEQVGPGRESAVLICELFGPWGIADLGSRRDSARYDLEFFKRTEDRTSTPKLALDRRRWLLLLQPSVILAPPAQLGAVRCWPHCRHCNFPANYSTLLDSIVRRLLNDGAAGSAAPCRNARNP